MKLHISNIVRKFQYAVIKGSNRSKSNLCYNKTYDKNSADSVRPKNIVTLLPPLTEPLKDLPEAVYAKPKPEENITQVTTLSNGLKVASENRFGQFCTIGVVINSGSRYELAHPKGISHFLEKLAFQSTLNYSSKDEILGELEKYGGICDCQSFRDTLIYASSISNKGIELVTKLLADVVFRPKLNKNEINLARQGITFELESLGMRPEQDLVLMDMIHAAAYKNNTLGFPKLCPADSINKIGKNEIIDYLRLYHTPERIVVAGVGVDHDAFVENVEKYFVQDEPIWGKVEKNSKEIDISHVQYTGGVIKEECNIPIYAAVGLPELAHVVIGLEACAHKDNDFIATCVLNIIMGGGGSFSSGGPGKGMYTRLYTNVLNRYPWMYSATACNHAYIDTGLFCVHASAPPNYIREMTEAITHELIAMANEPEEQELRRGKNQLQSMLLMNLESRPVVFEDIGRQVLANGHRKPPEHFINLIEKVEAKDVVNVARKMLSSIPSLAARGCIKDLPELKDLHSKLLNRKGKTSKSKRFSFYLNKN